MPADYPCPHCRRAIGHDPALAGHIVDCPHCRKKLRAPDAAHPRPLAVGDPVEDEPTPPPAITRTRPSSRPSGTAGTTTARTTRRIPRAGFRPPTSLLDFFDWRFDKYLTPWIIRITWVSCLVLAAMWLIVISLGVLVAMAPDVELPSSRSSPQVEFGSDEPMLPSWIRSRFSAVMVGITTAWGVAMMLLWIRVALETEIVIFRIAESLMSIDEKLTPAEGA